MKSATEQFLVDLRKEINLFSSNYGIKLCVGDSVDNNRVPSVRQVIRYLEGSISPTEVQSSKLDAVYGLLRGKNLFRKVRKNNNRTDAYDINEFFTVVNRYVLKNPALKGQVSKVVNSN